jgi:hypothetical protein
MTTEKICPRCGTTGVVHEAERNCIAALGEQIRAMQSQNATIYKSLRQQLDDTTEIARTARSRTTMIR